MTNDDVIYRSRLRLFALAKEMGSVRAACRMLGVKTVIPMHFATFSALTGTPDALRDLLHGSGIEIRDLKAGETTNW